jgi:hypothetical protein
MEKRIFEQDELLGITRIWHFDEETDTAVIETIQNVQPIVESNKSEFNQVDERARWDGEGHGVRVASIPMNLFRTRPGRV